VADWVVISSLATAGGTLVLAGATFSSVRSANRAARTAERALLVGLRPVLVPSRLTDPEEKISWMDNHWTHLRGGRATVEFENDVVYLTMSLRNVGSGIGVLQGWRPYADRLLSDRPHGDTADFRNQTRDLYVPSGDVSFWQGALRDPSEPEHAPMAAAIRSRQPVTIELLYSDEEGGNRTISRFALSPGRDDGCEWYITVSRHWYLDRDDPR
jgi:hypothetical protein